MQTLHAALLASALVASNAPPDGWITAKAKLTLLTRARLEGVRVHVDTNDRVVTVYGKVPDAARKQAAEAAVREIKGVRAVKNLLQIVPAAADRAVARTDADIKEHVDRILNEDPALADSRITLKSVDKGVVLLGGRAKTFSDRLRAVSDVDQIAGVRRVVSQIEAPEEYGAGERNLFTKEPRLVPRDSLTDTRITAEVKMRLLGAASVPAMDINVDTRDGVVTLFGAVPDDLAKSRAEGEAAEVSGVIRVKNQLEIASKPKAVAAGDGEIEREVKQRLAGKPVFDGVGVTVSDGTVRLTGTVATPWEKLEVMRLARSAKGVRALHEEIDVGPRRF